MAYGLKVYVCSRIPKPLQVLLLLPLTSGFVIIGLAFGHWFWRALLLFLSVFLIRPHTAHQIIIKSPISWKITQYNTNAEVTQQISLKQL